MKLNYGHTPVMKFAVGTNWGQFHNFFIAIVCVTVLSTDFINVLSQNYLKLHQPFDLSHVPAISIECRMHSHIFVDSLKKFELWALKSKFLSIQSHES